MRQHRSNFYCQNIHTVKQSGICIYATDKTICSKKGKKCQCARKSQETQHKSNWKPFRKNETELANAKAKNTMRIRQNPSTNYFNSMLCALCCTRFPMLPVARNSNALTCALVLVCVCSSVFRRSWLENQCNDMSAFQFVLHIVQLESG